MSPSGTWLAWALGLALVTAHVVIKPAPPEAPGPRMSDSTRRNREWRGRLAPPLTLDLLDGSRVALAGPSSAPTVVIFVTSWCEACRDTLTEVRRWAAQPATVAAAPRVVVIDVQEPAVTGRAYLAAHAATLGAGVDVTGDLTRAYELRTFPTTVVIGRDGRTRLYHEGWLINADVALGPAVFGGPAPTRGATP